MFRNLVRFASIFTLISILGCQENREVFELKITNVENGTITVKTTLNSKESVFTEPGALKLEEGTKVAIIAKGNPGYKFSFWNGVDNYTNSLFLEVNNNIEIGAEFFQGKYNASIDPLENGKIIVTPEIVSGRTYPANTKFTIKAIPDPGYTIDSLYYGYSGEWWNEYFEECNSDTLSVELYRDLYFGASFIESSELKGLEVIQDVVYAKPGEKSLKYDVFKPENANNLPLFVIVHGGGWSSNDEDIMRGMAREIAKTGKYVVASIDYRWIGHLDGDVEENTINLLIEDVYGAIAHIIERSDQYGIDSSRIAITGDSAGGHLSASAATMIERIGDGGFGIKENIYEYLPTYLPNGVSASEFREELSRSLKVAAPSYGVFLSSDIGVSPAAASTLTDSQGQLEAVSPLNNIPNVSDRKIPHFLVRGTLDPIISYTGVSAYATELENRGQNVEHIEVSGAGHAFYDWKPNRSTKDTFFKVGVPYIEQMINFTDRYINE